MRHTILITIAVAGGLFGRASAQLAPNAPEDRPQSIAEQQQAAFEAAIAPYVAQAKQSYPSAKARFEEGLPEGQTFYMTTRLRDPAGRWEQVFIQVHSIMDQTVIGEIASDVRFVSGYEFGQEYSFDESEMIDWLITRPNGSEEGNVVGKFLDTYQP
jgi:hypothetical protein